MGILWLAPSLMGCWSTTATPIQCHTTCVADPAPHCIAEDACTDDADCRGGLSCLAVDDIDAGTSTPKTCRWQPHLRPQALIEGFGSHTMEFEVTRSPKLGLKWMSPGGTWFITCAIFTCNPAIRERPNDAGNPSDEAPTDETTLWQIANADVCMFERHVLDASRMTISLDGTATPLTDRASPCQAPRAYDRVIDFFAAGCFAYDSNQVIAASELVPIAAEDIASVVPVSTTCVRDAELCYDVVHQFYGSCLAGQCAPRCADDTNCADIAADLFHESRDAAERWHCEQVPASLVGACRRPAGPSMTTELGADTAAHERPGP